MQTISRIAILLMLVSLALGDLGCSGLLAPSIVGKWELDGTPSNKMEFFPDGTLRETALLNTSNGKYTLLDGNRMKMEIDGILWGTNVTTFKYSIEGDKLTMTGEEGLSVTLNWRRSK